MPASNVSFLAEVIIFGAVLLASMWTYYLGGTTPKKFRNDPAGLTRWRNRTAPLMRKIGIVLFVVTFGRLAFAFLTYRPGQ